MSGTTGADRVASPVGQASVTAVAYLHTPEDGSAPYWVVDVDTFDAPHGVPMRIYVNDEPVWRWGA